MIPYPNLYGRRRTLMDGMLQADLPTSTLQSLDDFSWGQKIEVLGVLGSCREPAKASRSTCLAWEN